MRVKNKNREVLVFIITCLFLVECCWCFGEFTPRFLIKNSNSLNSLQVVLSEDSNFIVVKGDVNNALNASTVEIYVLTDDSYPRIQNSIGTNTPVSAAITQFFNQSLVVMPTSLFDNIQVMHQGLYNNTPFEYINLGPGFAGNPVGIIAPPWSYTQQILMAFSDEKQLVRMNCSLPTSTNLTCTNTTISFENTKQLMFTENGKILAVLNDSTVNFYEDGNIIYSLQTKYRTSNLVSMDIHTEINKTTLVISDGTQVYVYFDYSQEPAQAIGFDSIPGFPDDGLSLLFGSSVKVNNQFLIIGAPEYDKVFIFLKTNTQTAGNRTVSYEYYSSLSPSTDVSRTSASGFGNSISLENNVLLVTDDSDNTPFTGVVRFNPNGTLSYYYPSNSSVIGAVYVYMLDCGAISNKYSTCTKYDNTKIVLGETQSDITFESNLVVGNYSLELASTLTKVVIKGDLELPREGTLKITLGTFLEVNQTANMNGLVEVVVPQSFLNVSGTHRVAFLVAEDDVNIDGLQIVVITQQQQDKCLDVGITSEKDVRNLSLLLSVSKKSECETTQDSETDSETDSGLMIGLIVGLVGGCLLVSFVVIAVLIGIAVKKTHTSKF